MKKSLWDISLTRSTAMLLIILTHFFSEISSLRFIGQVTNSAIYTFLFISGYLYGRKDILSFKKWIVQRWIKIMTPIYIWLISIILYRIFIMNPIDISSILIYLFNLQGLLHGIIGIDHLWFTTFMMICYIITPLLQRYRNKYSSFKINKKVRYLIISIVIQVVVSILINPTLGKNLSYVNIYIVGYYFSISFIGKFSTKTFILFSFIATISLFIRFYFKLRFDDTAFYESVIVANTRAVLGIYIFVFCNYIAGYFKGFYFKKIVSSFDKISYELFITHYSFIVGPYLIWGKFPLIISVAFVLISTIISALFLKLADKFFANFISRTILKF